MSDTGELVWAWATSFEVPPVEWQAVPLGLLPVAALVGAGVVFIRDQRTMVNRGK